MASRDRIFTCVLPVSQSNFTSGGESITNDTIASAELDAAKVISLLLLVGSQAASGQDTLRLNNIDAILYTGNMANQPLIVGLGGSEGGNAWASRHWAKTRNTFSEKGYAFLAIGYFKTPNSSALLDRIAVEDVYQAIMQAKKNPKINPRKIALIGGSRGAELALLVGHYYQDISCIISLSGGHVVFPGQTDHLSASGWTFAGKPLPFVPVNDEAVPYLLKHDLRAAFEAMLTDSVAEQQSLIPVETIQGAILLLSGTQDEIWPSTKMSEKIMFRLKQRGFAFPYEHVAYVG